MAASEEWESVPALRAKLAKLQPTQESIETLSQWCIFHRRRAKAVVSTWEQELVAATASRKARSVAQHACLPCACAALRCGGAASAGTRGGAGGG